jgi:hypothetical protein
MRRTGRSVYNQSEGTHSGYRKIGHMTYWAAYQDGADVNVQDGSGVAQGCQVMRPSDTGSTTEQGNTSRMNLQNDTLTLVNIYAHRMSIEVEQVWNGHKTREEFLLE